jgi:LacI family transcriptional regulator
VAGEAVKRRVTVDDVAAHAGVSQATVSQVLNGSRPVSEATRARVQASIQELGYRPNQIARALRGQKSRTVAIIVPSFVQEFYPWMALGVSEVLRPEGYQVALYYTDGVRATETQVARVVAERVTDGAIVFGSPLHKADARIFAEFGITVVNGGLSAGDAADYDTVRVAQEEAFSGLVQLLGERYDGLIAHIAGPPGHDTAPVREAGFRAGLAAFGTPEADVVVAAATAYSWEAGRAAAAGLLDSGRRPRLLVCANDLLAIGAMAAARERGLRVPGDLAVTGYDNIVAAGMAVPPLTTVEPFAEEQGRACARLLLERMSGGYDGPPRHLVLSTEVIERESA